MIELIEGREMVSWVLGAVGKVTAEDYESISIPAVETALAIEGKPRMPYVLGSGFEGYDAGAVLDDARMGLHHWSDFERIAVVTDHDMYRTMIKGFGFLLPGQVKVFGVHELDQAKEWIAA